MLARFAEVIGPEPRSLADVGTFRLREPVVGVAPFNRDSGRWRGKGRQGCGEGGAVHGDVGGDQMESYLWLIRARRPVKVALVACMRKLLVILNAIVRDGGPWRYSPASP